MVETGKVTHYWLFLIFCVHVKPRSVEPDKLSEQAMNVRIALATVKNVHKCYSVLYSKPVTIHSEKIINRPG